MITRLAPDDDNAELAVDGNGDPFESDFMRSLACWVYCQDREVPIEEAAMSWNATPDVIRQAVEEHPFLCEVCGHIEQDGL